MAAVPATANDTLIKFLKREILLTGTPPLRACQLGGIEPDVLEELIRAGHLPRLGRPEDYPYIIGVKNRAGFWPARINTELFSVKERHDRGLVNLTYFTGENVLVMYAFPTKTKIFRKPWFTGQGEL